MGGACDPRAEASYEELAVNASLFFEKLENFCSSLGTHSRSCCVDETRVNLHELFVEVTSRGGLEQVVRDRKWKEVVSALKSPKINISLSFVLRKTYTSTLYDFEQVYFFRKSRLTAGLADSTSRISGNQSALDPAEEIHEESINHSPASPKLQTGISVVGVIDGKFDSGYVVSVDLGSSQLKGILYHVSDKLPLSWVPNPCVSLHQDQKESGLDKPMSYGQALESKDISLQ